MQSHDTTNDIPYGYCHCGCGQKTNIAQQTSERFGWIIGEPFRYLQGHGRRASREMFVISFWANVDRRAPDECWEWQGTKDKDGYGFTHFQGKKHRAHRESYELSFGPIPGDRKVLHRCDNPACCNPHHLFLGTDADNMQDKVQKGRQPRGDDSVRAKLTQPQVIEIRQRHRDERLSAKRLAPQYGVSVAAIDCILRRKTWKHVP